jgi:LmbE family N-acetylglucosaminyl deacetylase
LKHLFLSPHLDDAIFSCGGLMYRQVSANEPVHVINLCAGTPDYNQLSPFAQQYHTTWGNPPDMVALRREEDRLVLKAWGIEGIYFDTPDSIYRIMNGRVLYPDERALFSDPTNDEITELPQRWEEKIVQLGFQPGETILYAPLAAGNHVDHQLGRMLGRRFESQGWNVNYYEDFPHAEDPITLGKALSWFAERKWQEKTVLIDIRKKILAMEGYTSQIPFIFGDSQDLTLRVKTFTAERARQTHIGERVRYWLVGSGGRRERTWRALFGYHAHAERYWSQS